VGLHEEQRKQLAGISWPPLWITNSFAQQINKIGDYQPSKFVVAGSSAGGQFNGGSGKIQG
jgi:hypothetical protein